MCLIEPCGDGGEDRIRVFDAVGDLRFELTESSAATNRLSGATTSLPDIDGDGALDFAIGNPSRDDCSGPGGCLVGAGAIVAFGSRNGALLWRVEGTAAGQRFGTALLRVGDRVFVGGDTTLNAHGDSTGALFVVDLFGVPVVSRVVYGEQDGDGFGAAIAPVGDLDGDGFNDGILVGAPGADGPAGADAGRVYAFTSALDLVVTFEGPAAGARMGHSSATILPKQGAAPLIFVGAPEAFGESGMLAVYEWSGALRFSTTGAAFGDRLGESITSATDFDLDGTEEVAVGAPGAALGAGQVFILRADGVAVDVLTGAPGDGFGVRVASPGDLDGDGFFDLLVGMLNRVWPDGGARPGSFIRYSGLGGGPQEPPPPMELP